MKPAALLLSICAVAQAHVISMSYGYATLAGNRVDYILRMPEYEAPKGIDIEKALFDHIRFSSGFETARRTESECHLDAPKASYLCAATFVFPQPVSNLDVDCTFFDVTVPNHIHMLHAETTAGGVTKTDQAIFDSSLSSAKLLFRPPTAFETALRQVWSGAKRTWTTWAQLLLLIAIALASRTPRELGLNWAAFVVGQCAVCAALSAVSWRPAPRFAEAAASLALAYLAFEMLAFPRSGGRWMIALVFGAFSGMYFATFADEAGFRSSLVLAGSAAAALLIFSAMSSSYLIRSKYRESCIRVVSIPLLVTGAAWFITRLRG